MSTKFIKGQTVTQVQPDAIEGVVQGFGFDPNTGNVNVLVSYKDQSGNYQQRYFNQDQLVATAE